MDTSKDDPSFPGNVLKRSTRFGNNPVKIFGSTAEVKGSGCF